MVEDSGTSGPPDASERDAGVEPAALAANAGVPKEICAGDAVVIGGSATGGVAPYSYGWTATPSCDAPGCLSDPHAEAPSVSPAESTVFVQSVTDSAHAEATASVTVTVLPRPGSAGSDATTSPGRATSIGPVGFDGATYAWSCNRDDCALSSSSGARVEASPVRSTRYVLDASWPNACADRSELTVWVDLVAVSAPADGQIEFPASSPLLVQFDQPIDPSSLSAAAVVLEDSSTAAAIPTSFALDPTGRVLVITPPSPGTSGYEAGGDYTLVLKGGAEGIVSDDPILPNRLRNDLQIDFTTAPVDVTPPGFVFRSPAPGEIDVPPNTSIVIVFDEPVAPETLTASGFSLSDAGGAVPAAVTYDFATRTATLVPSASMQFSATYSVTLTGIEDLSGNVLSASWMFQTSSAADLTPPTVLAVTPAPGATGVSSGTTVTVEFSESIDVTTLSGISLAVPGGTAIAAAVAWDAVSRAATLTPAAPLQGNTLHALTVTGVKDLAGNAMAAPFTSTFTTRTTIFSDNFENGSGNWTLGAWGLASNTFASASTSLTDSPGARYAANVNSAVELASPISVSGFGAVSLQFALRTRAEKTRDVLWVEYRLDGGAWVPLYKPGTSGGWAGNAQWARWELPINVAGASALELRFRFTSNQNKQFDGVYVDDVIVQSM